MPTGDGVRVAVIDSGWDRGTIDRRIETGVGLVDPSDELGTLISSDDDDRIGHGTACADIVLRVAPAARIVPIRVFGGKLETSVPTLIAALDHALEVGAHVINLSLGTQQMHLRQLLYDACARVRRANGILVAASNAHGRSLPAAFGNVIAVEVDDSLKDPWFKCRRDTALDCIARGRHEDVRWRGGMCCTVYGSSFAAPVLSGAVALLLSSHPGARMDSIRRLLLRYEATHHPLEQGRRG